MATRNGSGKGQDNGAGRRGFGNVGQPADWGAVQPENIMALIVAVTGAECAVRFGYSRDGGAFAIGFLGDGEPYTRYIGSTEDIDSVLLTIADNFR